MDGSMVAATPSEGVIYELQRLAEEVEVHADALSQHYNRIDSILRSPEPEADKSPGYDDASVSDVVDRLRTLTRKIEARTSELRSITRRVTL